MTGDTKLISAAEFKAQQQERRLNRPLVLAAYEKRMEELQDAVKFERQANRVLWITTACLIAAIIALVTIGRFQ